MGRATRQTTCGLVISCAMKEVISASTSGPMYANRKKHDHVLIADCTIVQLYNQD